MSASCCQVGARSDVDAIDAALREGKPIRGIADRHGLSFSAIQRHRTHVLGPPPLPPPEEPCPHVEPEVIQPEAHPEEARRSNVIHADFGSGQHDSRRVDRKEEAKKERKAARDDARTRARAVAESCDSWEDRVAHVADLIATGQYLGRPTVRELARGWAVNDGTVQNYARAGSLLAKADRGALEVAREQSLGQWARLRDEALDAGDTKGAVAAQAGWDRAAGVVEPGGPKVQVVNVLGDPRVRGLLDLVIATLREKHPGALPDVVAAVRASVEPARALGM